MRFARAVRTCARAPPRVTPLWHTVQESFSKCTSGMPACFGTGPAPFGPVWHSFEACGVHFCATPMKSGDAPPSYTPEMFAEWLANDLASIPRDRPVVLFNHSFWGCNLFDVTKIDKGVLTVAGLDAAAACNLVGLVYGHLHTNQFRRFGKIAVLQTSNPQMGGVDLSPASIRIVKADKPGRITSELRHGPKDVWPGVETADKGIWRVKVPGLEPDAAVALAIDAEYRTLSDKADANGNYFFYIADGRYLFKANGIDYAVIVAGGDAIARRIDLTPTGVFADGIDVSEGLGYGWRYDFSTSNLVVDLDGIVLSGTNTDGRVRVSIEADMALTVSNLVLAATDAAAVSLVSGVSASVVLAGDSELTGGPDHAALECVTNAALTIVGDGALTATGGSMAAGIGGGRDAFFGSVRIAGGTVTAYGGEDGAGIGGGRTGRGGTVEIDGGTTVATGGENGAGIGGGWNGSGNSISVKGGEVTAQGGSQASAIGPGDSRTAFFPTGDTISISGGIVRVNSGSSDAAAVGCSRYGSCGKISISGGTVLFPGNQQCHIGDGRQSRPESVTITGGSIAAERKRIYPLPTDGSKVLWRVTVDTGTANKMIEVSGLGGYGVKDISSDDAGKIYLWLPNGEYAFSAGGENYFAIVADADTVAARELPPLGLRVNGEDIAQRKGDGWFYDSDGVLTLSGLAGYALEADDPSYSNLVRVVVCGTTAVSVSNVVVASTIWRESALVVESGADATLTLFGTNVFTGAATGGAPGIAVRESAVLTIGGKGALVATGGQYGAGIGSVGPWGDYHGGGEGTAFGTIRIVGGNVTATGGERSAGIGSGLDGRGGTVEISGTGGTVTFGNLVTSNTVASTWTTSSTLKFTLKDSGVSPITVTNETTLTANTKVVVDASEYTRGRASHQLIACARENVTADLDALDATFIGASGAMPGHLELRTDGLYAVIPRGTTIILR